MVRFGLKTEGLRARDRIDGGAGNQGDGGLPLSFRGDAPASNPEGRGRNLITSNFRVRARRGARPGMTTA
jgi:hypothetical protein